jgi:type VI secretion system secreted protein Hcp
MKKIMIAAVVLGFAFSSFAIADDAFLKIDGIDGESTDLMHSGEVVLTSYTWGVENATTDLGGGSGKGKAIPRSLTFTTPYSKASPVLVKYAASGKHIANAVLSVRTKVPNQAGFEYLKITLKEANVELATTTLGTTGRPVDYYELSFDFIEFKYTTRNADGSVGGVVSMCWNTKTTETC